MMGWRPRHIRLGTGPEDEVETTHTRPGCRNGDVADTHWHRYRSATADHAAPVVRDVAWWQDAGLRLRRADEPRETLGPVQGAAHPRAAGATAEPYGGLIHAAAEQTSGVAMRIGNHSPGVRPSASDRAI